MRLNPVMRQAAGAAFGMPVALPAWREEAACGAALCAMVGCGALGSFEDAAALVRYEEA
jgi:sugar (pentulose or hexulose) kinase